MEPAAATSFPVALDPSPRPAPQAAQLGQGSVQRGWDRWAFPAIVSVVFIGTFACGVYLARDSPRDFGFVIVTYYLFALLLCCLEKLSLLRRDDPAAAAERWRVKLAVWVLLVMLADAIAKHVADAMPNLGLRIAVRVITGVVVGVGFYFFFLRGDAGCRRDSAVHQVSPEQRV